MNRKVYSLGPTRTLPEYALWKAMLRRCENPKDKGFKNYGARGIKVCARWKSFENFYKDMGARPVGKSLERRNNNRGYSPSNCYWADRATQNNNTRSNIPLTYLGRTQTVTQWCSELGLKPFTVYMRLRKGWTAERALSTPCAGKRAPRPYYRRTS